MWIKPTSFLVYLAFCLCLEVSAQATVGDLPILIENFMAKQFPEAKSRLWIVNGTQWETDNEVVVDMNAIVTGKTDSSPTESRFLLLIVGGQVAAAQNIPLDAKTDCKPEEA
jgi:hypothetical protein